jgi:hypothetical protein
MVSHWALPQQTRQFGFEWLISSVVGRLANSTNALARAEINFDAQVQKPVKTG